MAETRKIIVNRKTGKMTVAHPDDLQPGRNIRRSIDDGSILLIDMPDGLPARDVREGKVRVDVKTREISQKPRELWPENL